MCLLYHAPYICRVPAHDRTYLNTLFTFLKFSISYPFTCQNSTNILNLAGPGFVKKKLLLFVFVFMPAIFLDDREGVRIAVHDGVDLGV